MFLIFVVKFLSEVVKIKSSDLFIKCTPYDQFFDPTPFPSPPSSHVCIWSSPNHSLHSFHK